MSDTDTNTPAIAPAPRPPMVAGGTVAAIIPTTFEEAFRLGNAFHTAGMAPKGLNSAEQCTGVIIAGMELGLTPYVSLQSFANINGRTSLWGDAIPALLWSNGFKLREWFENSDPSYPDNMTAKCVVIRPDGTEIEGEFSVSDGKEAKLFDMKDGPWKTAKKRMLKMRARAFAARDGASDVLKGFPIYEEAMDFEDISETPRPVRGKKDLKARLAAPPAEETPPADTATSENGDVVDQTTGEVVEEGGPQGDASAPIAEDASASKASAEDASTTSDKATPGESAPEVEAELENDAPTAEWWELTEISEGFPVPGERYRLAGDVGGDDGKVPTYADGEDFSRAGVQGSQSLKVYRAHAPKTESAEEDGDAQTDTETHEEASTTSDEDGGGFLGDVRKLDSWLTIKPRWIQNAKTEEWLEADPEDKDIVKAMVRSHVEKIGDPVDPAQDPVYFVIWIGAEDTIEGADLIEAKLASLEKSPGFAKLKDDAKARVRAQAETKVAALRGEE